MENLLFLGVPILKHIRVKWPRDVDLGFQCLPIIMELFGELGIS